MKKIEQWEEEKEQYILNNGFILKRANKFEFGIHETIYSSVDLGLNFSWEKQTVENIDYNPATILCVTIGNLAEGMYHRMGFFSGVKFTDMYLKQV